MASQKASVDLEKELSCSVRLSPVLFSWAPDEGASGPTDLTC